MSHVLLTHSHSDTIDPALASQTSGSRDLSNSEDIELHQQIT